MKAITKCWCEVVEHMRRVTVTGEEHERLAPSAPVEDFEVSPWADQDPSHAMWRWDIQPRYQRVRQ